VTATYAIAALVGKPASIADFGFTLAFLRTYLPAQPDLWSSPLPIGHLWSLNVEEHSYIMMSMVTLVAVLKRREGSALICAGFMAMAIRAFYSTHPALAPQNYFIRTECAMSFIMISAGYSLLKHKVSHYVRPSMPLVALLLAAAFYTDCLPLRGAGALLGPVLLSFAVNHLSESGSALIFALQSRMLRLLGTWSYSIYLWQQPCFAYKNYLPPGVALLLAVTLGVASFYLYENPIRVWLNEREYTRNRFLQKDPALIEG
jgi:peptidoglycan/LPS O-acetylase OafA/YrhL